MQFSVIPKTLCECGLLLLSQFLPINILNSYKELLRSSQLDQKENNWEQCFLTLILFYSCFSCRGVMANVLDDGLEVNEFKLQSRYYFHF